MSCGTAWFPAPGRVVDIMERYTMGGASAENGRDTKAVLTAMRELFGRESSLTPNPKVPFPTCNGACEDRAAAAPGPPLREA